MDRLRGKVAIVTGAGAGIGRAIAVAFAAEGATVACADHSGEEATVARELGDGAIAVPTDVTSSAAIASLVATTVERFGRLDVLVNNVGSGGDDAPVHEIDDDAFDRMITLNLRSTFSGMKHAIPAMLASGGGSIVNIASVAGLVGLRGKAAYAAAKGGVIQLTKTAALDYATDGIRVNAICPGMTWTARAQGVAGHDGGPPPGLVPPQPVKRWGLPDELAAAAVFLASDEASFVTGAALPVDGGYSAR